ncbi:protein adenylyltransferase SelO [Rheinheimera sp. F8]|uniref:protein adenylyltransferase SelO n=1 Tax=Rheinheimera sp. F8 TaxID=1763998 RepID=UPI000744C24A|nr:YdiU family protein [Rheinheimera sp. F8]ALZ75188.1 hypothetical protein ATY27_05075 [Rheinheimera sp. F8]ALZ76387.1 hypothetical protein ATY27_11870 [Rheinheimera sp. F8]
MPFTAELTYRTLGPLFYQTVAPTPVAAPDWLLFNAALAAELQWPEGARQTPLGLQYFCGNQLAPWMQPTALAYTGHQFGSLAPRLGDGRALLLTEVLSLSGKRFDVQLKGAGPTPFSRRGDGRAALGPVLREYLISEWMAAVGVRTSRALAAVTTGETIYRDTRVPGAVLTRVAASHIRIGTFQYASMHGSSADVKALADYVITRHYAEIRDDAQPYLALLRAVATAQADLIAHWMSLGFVHGVMNTDNMTVSGETIDYGPCAFIDAFDPSACFSSIDSQGRYAYRNQPPIAQWNLARLAESLLVLLHEDEQQAIAAAMTVLNDFPALYQAARLKRFAAKLGLPSPLEPDLPLIDDLLTLLSQQQIDFTLFFRELSRPAAIPGALAGQLFAEPAAFNAWQQRWLQRLTAAALDPVALSQQLLQANPAFIPRNFRIEQIIDSALNGDLGPARAFVNASQTPFDDELHWAELPPASFCNYQTFCGT